MGCLFYYLLFRCYLFNGESKLQIAINILKIFGCNNYKLLGEVYNFPPNSRFSDKFDDRSLSLIMKLFEFDPSKRISASEALNHEYFQT